MRREYARGIHFLAGIITALASWHIGILGLLLFAVFIIYELDEDWHISDMAFLDILDYAIGLYICSLIILYFHLGPLPHP